MSLQQITLPKVMSKLSNKDSYRDSNSEVITDLINKNKDNPQGNLLTPLLLWVQVAL